MVERAGETTATLDKLLLRCPSDFTADNDSGVFTYPGFTLVTWMPLSRVSERRESKNELAACFDAESSIEGV